MCWMLKARQADEKSVVCGSLKNGVMTISCRAMGKKEKMPPPPLFTITIVNAGTSGPVSCCSALRSWREATSPITSVAGEPVPWTKPTAVLITPSMPEAPRLEAGGRPGPTVGSVQGLAKKSRSRMGIELEICSEDPGRRRRDTVRATNGSVRPWGGAIISSITSPAASESRFQKGGGPPAGSRPARLRALASVSSEQAKWWVATWS
mmetsp:Transcript_16241/g.38101  ORF Transcript_16241/g.38101 Transcript_16241/m.38101 type:complete len:207 (-) Transcript_16241:105-725(-)